MANYDVTQDKLDLEIQLNILEKQIEKLRIDIANDKVRGLAGWEMIDVTNRVNLMTIRIAQHQLKQGGA